MELCWGMESVLLRGAQFSCCSFNRIKEEDSVDVTFKREEGLLLVQGNFWLKLEGFGELGEQRVRVQYGMRILPFNFERLVGEGNYKEFAFSKCKDPSI